MAFNKIVPPAREARVQGGTAMVRVAILETRKGSGKLKTSIVLADTFLTGLHNHEKFIYACVFEGSDDDYGKLRIEVANKEDVGALKLGRLHKGGARLQMSLPFAARPNKPIGNLACKVISQDETGFVIELPLLDWTEVTARSKIEDRRTTAQTQATARQEQDQGQLTNLLGGPVTGDVHCKPVEYLAKKGIRLAKMAGNFWQYHDASGGGERERIDNEELLARINKIRTKSGLNKIGMHQLVMEQ